MTTSYFACQYFGTWPTYVGFARLFDASVVQLETVDSYKILSQSDCTTLDGVDDAEEFRGVKAAFDTIGMDEESQMQVWQVLASVLHMSNLEFDKVDHEQGEIASICDRKVCMMINKFRVCKNSVEFFVVSFLCVNRGDGMPKHSKWKNEEL